MNVLSGGQLGILEVIGQVSSHFNKDLRASILLLWVVVFQIVFQASKYLCSYGCVD